MPRTVGCRGCGSSQAAILPRHLELRVSFLTRRFARHAPYWQFAIWLRQFALFVIAFTLGQIERRIDGLATPVPSRAARYSLSMAAMATMVAAWVAHSFRRPYAFK